MRIPMVDLQGELALYGDALKRSVGAVIDSCHFIHGPQVAGLEAEIAAYYGVQHAVAVASGTDALHLALRGAGVGPGDEVITTAFTFIATAEAVAHAGAEPRFVDIDPATFNIDVRQVEAAITPRTRAVIAVHLYGACADLDALTALCRRHELVLIEDCAQSFGATHDGRQAGTFGAAGCLSFYPSKNLGAFGDGGMIVTHDAALAQAARMLRDHGSEVRYLHRVIGYNSRLDEIQAAILRLKLERADAFNAARTACAQAYAERLRGLPIGLPHHEAGRVWHQYTIRSARRDALRQALEGAGIASAVHYPLPLHRQPVYAEQFAALTLPHAERAAEEVLSLPMHPLLTTEQIDEVCAVVARACVA